MSKLSEFQMDQTPGYLIYLAAMRNRLVLKKVYRNTGYEITPEQLALLNRLYEKEGVTQRQLAEGTFKDNPNTTRLIDQLEKQGLVERKDHPSDRRAACLILTALGRKTRTELVQALIKLGERVYKKFSKSEKEQFIQLIRKFHESLEKEL